MPDATYTYAGLANINLLHEFEKYESISIDINQKQKDRLQSTLDRYHRHAIASAENLRGLRAVWYGILWALADIYLLVFDERLHKLSQLYVLYASRLRPVEFNTVEKNLIRVYFRKRP